MKTSEPHKRSPLKFFILTFSLATPFWVLNSLVKVEGLPLEIPVTDLALAFMPLTAAVILVYREEGPGDAKKLLKRIFDYKRTQQKIWYLPIVLLMPFLYVLIYWSMRLIGLTLPAEPHIPLLTMALLFVLFFVLAAGEEIGWMGYAADPLQDRWSALAAGFILGLVFGYWALSIYVRTGPGSDLDGMGYSRYHWLEDTGCMDLLQHRQECVCSHPFPRHYQSW